MSLNDGGTAPSTRRRGAELEEAILKAAWELLVVDGYPNFTFESVAARAQTSRPVLYRRWQTKDDLLLAAVRYGGGAVDRSVPDTGSLRGDVIALLTRFNGSRAEFIAVLVGQLGAFYSATGSSPAAVREAFIGDRPTVMQAVIDRAITRGEVDPERLTPRIVALPVDLVRQRIMMTLKPVPKSEIAGIVDEIFLPLVRPQ